MRVDELLPIHGFVLAGGKSSRMGADKAMLEFGGRPMVEIAVEKLRSFCADVSIAGNRDDLSRFAPVVLEERIDAGPAAGIEAGLEASRQEWALFVPVDVPLVPAELLRRWADFAIHADKNSDAESFAGLMGTYLRSGEIHHPTFCLLRRRLLPIISRQLDHDHRSLRKILDSVLEEFGAGSLLALDAAQFAPASNTLTAQLNSWFYNVNTPQELLEAEAWSSKTS